MGADITDLNAVSVQSGSICVSVENPMFKQHMKTLAVLIILLGVIGFFFVLSNHLTFALQK